MNILEFSCDTPKDWFCGTHKQTFLIDGECPKCFTRLVNFGWLFKQPERFRIIKEKQ